LVYWILDLISSIIDYFSDKKFFKNLNNKNNENKKRNDYLCLLILNASDLLAGILVLITHYRMK
jgi:uncharacterized membrane protein